MPDDERKGRRLGDETKNRIADLASGWTVNGDDAPEPPAPEPYVRRKAPTLPPPAPGSAARKALEHKIVELGDVFDSLDSDRAPSDALDALDLGDDDDDDDEADKIDDEDDDEPAPPPPPSRTKPPTPPPARPLAGPTLVAPRPRTGPTPLSRRYDGGDPLDLGAIPSTDKTQENRGAVGMRPDKSGPHTGGALTSNSVSGTIGDDTPAPIFDRAAIAAGQKGAVAADKVARTGSGTGSVAARGTPVADAPPNATVVGTGVSAKLPSGKGALPSAPPSAPAPFWPGSAAPLPSAPPPAPEPSWPSAKSPPAKPAPAPAAEPDDSGVLVEESATRDDESGILLSGPDKKSAAARDDESGILLSGPDKKLASRSDDSEASPPAKPEKRSFFGLSLGDKSKPAHDKSTAAPSKAMDTRAPSTAVPSKAIDTAAPSMAAPSKLTDARSQPTAAPSKLTDARSQPTAAPSKTADTHSQTIAAVVPPVSGRSQPAGRAQPEARRRSPTSSVPALLQEPLVPSGRIKRPTAAEPMPIVQAKPDDSIVELDASELSVDEPGFAGRGSAAGWQREVVDDSASFAVPVGEFDPPQATVVRDPASALLQIPSPPEPRADPTINVEPEDEERGDPTAGDGDGERDDATTASADHADATVAASPSRSSRPSIARPTAGTLRSAAALPRRQGFFGDLRYVFTVVFGVRRANRELGELDAQQASRQQTRRHHLISLGRAALNQREWRAPSVAGPSGEHRALGPARRELDQIEAERSQHTAQVVAADEELAHVRADRAAAAKQHTAELAAIDSELIDLGKKLEPLEKEAAAVRKRGAELQASLRRVDTKISSTEASLRHPKGNQDPIALQAELATLKADRKSIQRDEPVIAGELDALTPRIAAIEAARTEARSKRAEAERAEADDQRRVEELLAAIGAKRKVVERAVTDAETARDKILFALGERLYVDRPDDLAPQLAPIDESDVDHGVADRRMMELRELTASVDRWKVTRGVLYIVLILAALGAAAYFLVPMFT